MPAVATREISPISQPLDATVRPPGSKSATNRALVVAALVAEGSASRLINPLEADDTVVMRNGLRAMGVLVDDVDDPWLVLGTGGTVHGAHIDAGASGTTARFLAAVGALAHGTVTIDGTERMRQRPIGHLLTALEGLGATSTSNGGCPPITLTGPISAGRTRVSGAVSSQYLSALLLVSPVLGDRVVVEVTDGLVSRPYVDGTLDIMGRFGAEVRVAGDVYTVEPTGYRKAHLEIEADASAAVYPAVAAAIAGGRVVITGIPAASSQPDLLVLDRLAAMGCTVEWADGAVTVESSGDTLEPIDTDLSMAPDGALGLAVACLFASGPSRLRGLGTLRVKETDRLSALRTELRRLGAGAEIEGDALVIEPGLLGPAEIETYDDHRMAMAFALVGLRVDGVVIRDPGCVTKTWPGYFEALEAMCRV